MIMSAKSQHNNILLAVAGFAAVVVVVALIGFFALGREPELIQGQVEVTEYRVSSKVPGRILELRVKEGDYVRKGDTLAILDAPDVQAKLAQARSAEDAAAAMDEMARSGARAEQVRGAFQVLQQAKAGLDIARKSYGRVQRLYDEGVMTEQKRDEAFANFKAMEAQVKAAQSQYDMARNGARREEKMAAAAREAGRDPAAVQLCAACKTRTAQTIAASAALPIDVFGENHVQELCANYDAGAYCGKPSHFIGHLQTNKIKKVLGRASLIQSVDSEHLLLAIEKEAAKAGIVQDILLEVNIGGEESKTGAAPELLWPLLDTAAAQQHIRVKGLMAIPPVNDDDAQNRRYLAQVYQLFVRAGERGYRNVEMQTLSMGMSGDFENAIREGATLVRIGTAIYGARDYSKK